MKTKGIIILLAVFLFSSCIVKSLQPFYTEDSLSFNEKLLGSWTDNKKGQWTVESIKEKFEQDRKEGTEFSEEDLRLLETYKEGYYVNYVKNDKEAGFFAMPFKIEKQYFIDFIPIEIEEDEINGLAAEHLLKTHSVSKLDMYSDDSLSFSWLSEERISDLFSESKLRLKHENIGPEKTLLLTATSEELYAFLKKYLQADIEEKWKSTDRLTLTRVDAEP